MKSSPAAPHQAPPRAAAGRGAGSARSSAGSTSPSSRARTRAPAAAPSPMLPRHRLQLRGRGGAISATSTGNSLCPRRWVLARIASSSFDAPPTTVFHGRSNYTYKNAGMKMSFRDSAGFQLGWHPWPHRWSRAATRLGSTESIEAQQKLGVVYYLSVRGGSALTELGGPRAV